MQQRNCEILKLLQINKNVYKYKIPREKYVESCAQPVVELRPHGWKFNRVQLQSYIGIHESLAVEIPGLIITLQSVSNRQSRVFID